MAQRRLLRHRSRGVQPRFPTGGFARPPYVLSVADRDYLATRAVSFVETLSQCDQVPVSAVAGTEGGRLCVARLAAHALVGDDDAQPQRWLAAREYVVANLPVWFPGPETPG